MMRMQGVDDLTSLSPSWNTMLMHPFFSKEQAYRLASYVHS